MYINAIKAIIAAMSNNHVKDKASEDKEIRQLKCNVVIKKSKTKVELKKQY